MEPFPVTRVGHIEQQGSEASWMIESLWADQAVGFIGGPPRSGKTWLALEMAFAVASGLPCLGAFPVQQRGHVLLYAAEDAASAIRTRFCGIAQARGFRHIERLAVGLINACSLRLDSPEHQERLTATIDKLRPRLLILDPLVRLHCPDKNSVAGIGSLLDFLRHLQRSHSVSIVLVHHGWKSSSEQSGLVFHGSEELQAWPDSGLSLLQRRDRLQLLAEHRSFPSPAPVFLELKATPQPHLCVIPNQT